MPHYVISLIPTDISMLLEFLTSWSIEKKYFFSMITSPLSLLRLHLTCLLNFQPLSFLLLSFLQWVHTYLKGQRGLITSGEAFPWGRRMEGLLYVSSRLSPCLHTFFFFFNPLDCWSTWSAVWWSTYFWQSTVFSELPVLLHRLWNWCTFHYNHFRPLPEFGFRKLCDHCASHCHCRQSTDHPVEYFLSIYYATEDIWLFKDIQKCII